MAIDDTTARRLLGGERRRLEEALALTAQDLAEERLGQTDELSTYADERLRAMPSTPFCITHAEAAAAPMRPGASPA